ncbi:MAG: hypothetical protein IT381_05935 [Deltaproteobacteria bacterium]|nr:hypothetical protein [Deltaproteobacteria bacterium]
MTWAEELRVPSVPTSAGLFATGTLVPLIVDWSLGAHAQDTWPSWQAPTLALLAPLTILAFAAAFARIAMPALLVSNAQVVMQNAWVSSCSAILLGLAVAESFSLSPVARATGVGVGAIIVAGSLLRMSRLSASEQAYLQAQQRTIKTWLGDREWLSTRILGGRNTMRERHLTCISFARLHAPTPTTLEVRIRAFGVVKAFQVRRFESASAALDRALPSNPVSWSFGPSPPLDPRRHRLKTELMTLGESLTLHRGIVASVDLMGMISADHPAVLEFAAALRRCFVVSPEQMTDTTLIKTISSLEELATSAIRTADFGQLRALSWVCTTITEEADDLAKAHEAPYDIQRSRFDLPIFAWGVGWPRASLLRPLIHAALELTRYDSVPPAFRVAVIGLPFDMMSLAIRKQFLLGVHYLFGGVMLLFGAFPAPTDRQFLLDRIGVAFDEILATADQRTDETDFHFIREAVRLVFSALQLVCKAAIEMGDEPFASSVIASIRMTENERVRIASVRRRASLVGESYAKLLDDVADMRETVSAGLFAYSLTQTLPSQPDRESVSDQLAKLLPKNFHDLLVLYSRVSRRDVIDRWEWTMWSARVDESLRRAFVNLLIREFPGDQTEAPINLDESVIIAELSDAPASLRDALRSHIEQTTHQSASDPKAPERARHLLAFFDRIFRDRIERARSLMTRASSLESGKQAFARAFVAGFASHARFRRLFAYKHLEHAKAPAPSTLWGIDQFLTRAILSDTSRAATLGATLGRELARAEEGAILQRILKQVDCEQSISRAAQLLSEPHPAQVILSNAFTWPSELSVRRRSALARERAPLGPDAYCQAHNRVIPVFTASVGPPDVGQWMLICDRDALDISIVTPHRGEALADSGFGFFVEEPLLQDDATKTALAVSIESALLGHSLVPLADQVRLVIAQALEVAVRPTGVTSFPLRR